MVGAIGDGGAPKTEEAKMLQACKEEFEKAYKEMGEAKAEAGAPKYAKSKYGAEVPSVRSAEENEAIRNAIRTPAVYNKAGWTLANDVLSYKEYGEFYSLNRGTQLRDYEFDEGKGIIHASSKGFEETSDGLYMIPVGDEQGIKNVLVFTDATENPTIHETVRISKELEARGDIETFISKVRGIIYECEKAGRHQWDGAVKSIFGQDSFIRTTRNSVPDYRARKTAILQQGTTGRGSGSQSPEVGNGSQTMQNGGGKGSRSSGQGTTIYDIDEEYAQLVRSGRHDEARAMLDEEAARLGFYRDKSPLTGEDVYISNDGKQMKLANLITKDNDGNDIPLTERFNRATEDERYSKGKSVSDTDTRGNPVSEEVNEFFRETTLRQKNGKLKVLYHGSPNKFNVFKPGDIGFHLGTKNQARTRVGKSGNVVEYYGNLKNPIEFDTDLGSWDADHRLADILAEREIITSAEAKEVLFTESGKRRATGDANRRLREMLQEKGYDGISYENYHEGPGKSYILFDSSQAKRIDNVHPTESKDVRLSKGYHAGDLGKSESLSSDIRPETVTNGKGKVTREALFLREM